MVVLNRRGGNVGVAAGGHGARQRPWLEIKHAGQGSGDGETGKQKMEKSEFSLTLVLTAAQNAQHQSVYVDRREFLDGRDSGGRLTGAKLVDRFHMVLRCLHGTQMRRAEDEARYARFYFG